MKNNYQEALEKIYELASGYGAFTVFPIAEELAAVDFNHNSFCTRVPNYRRLEVFNPKYNREDSLKIYASMVDNEDVIFVALEILEEARALRAEAEEVKVDIEDFSTRELMQEIEDRMEY